MPKLISLIIFNNTQSQQRRQRKRHLYRVHSRSLPDAGERALKNILINKQFIIVVVCFSPLSNFLRLPLMLPSPFWLLKPLFKRYVTRYLLHICLASAYCYSRCRLSSRHKLNRGATNHAASLTTCHITHPWIGY